MTCEDKLQKIMDYLTSRMKESEMGYSELDVLEKAHEYVAAIKNNELWVPKSDRDEQM